MLQPQLSRNEVFKTRVKIIDDRATPEKLRLQSPVRESILEIPSTSQAIMLSSAEHKYLNQYIMDQKNMRELNVKVDSLNSKVV